MQTLTSFNKYASDYDEWENLIKKILKTYEKSRLKMIILMLNYTNGNFKQIIW